MVGGGRGVGGGDIKPKMVGRREGQTIVCRYEGIVYGMTSNEESYLIDRTDQTWMEVVWHWMDVTHSDGMASQ
jgi:hypothetical protein